MNIFRDFFWFCSGANASLLKRCPTESSKYAGIGATVFFTGLFAAISASFALYTVFRVEWMAIAFGMVWGSMIFNLDRFIVSSMKKRKNFTREILMALPRLLLAILLALVISKPLELKIFEREILRVVDAQKVEQTQQTKEAVFQNFPEIEERQNKIDQLREEIRQKEAFRNTKQQEYDLERFGVQSDATSGIPGIGRNARMKETQLADAQQDLDMTRNRNQQQIALFDQQILDLYQQRDQEIDNQRATIDNYDGFAARIDALSKLTQESRAIFLANLFIILLFIAVETAPIITKIISPRGPYDDLLEKHEHKYAKQRIREVTQLEQETYENLHLLEERSKSNIRRELDVNRTTLREMTDAEIEIARKTVAYWKDNQLQKLSPEIFDEDEAETHDAGKQEPSLSELEEIAADNSTSTEPGEQKKA